MSSSQNCSVPNPSLLPFKNNFITSIHLLKQPLHKSLFSEHIKNEVGNLKKRGIEYSFLTLTTITGLILLPFAIVKRSFKDWLIVYLVSVIGNGVLDQYLVAKGYLKYPRKLFPNHKIHLPFDFIHYPLMLLYYNQWTLNSRLSGILFKLFPFVIPQTVIETIAAKRTKLITWKNGWTWYHTMTSLTMKLLVCRSVIALVRIINKGQISIK